MGSSSMCLKLLDIRKIHSWITVPELHAMVHNGIKMPSYVPNSIIVVLARVIHILIQDDGL